MAGIYSASAKPKAAYLSRFGSERGGKESSEGVAERRQSHFGQLSVAEMCVSVRAHDGYIWGPPVVAATDDDERTRRGHSQEPPPRSTLLLDKERRWWWYGVAEAATGSSISSVTTFLGDGHVECLPH
ncbi:hypothetical protein BS78_03G125800 [Paspalum vaginatum]|nr:hypothetical protein BS78_03G125800 [Paspalum vaginatum]KAJ1283401.1 hypothetical protein BS78_03G125800 [Paspalum vaginatum]KAJ1283402.1 hypothetical protein BS78_03G125800 [Paspalum vaginatum]KAJ1283403.1 hypothetical protein BS78_03G125800 [Paspalum vaginatum]KAJ1283404.1 hypothetical protein BS78_03G125800 [Paspalum vaginatum]